MKSILINTLSTNQDEGVRNAANNVLTQAAQNDSQLNQLVVNAAEHNDTLAQQLPPRFYIHYADDSRLTPPQVAAALKKQGYIVPGIQKANDPDAKTNQLRFRKDEPGMPTPEAIVSLLKSATGSK